MKTARIADITIPASRQRRDFDAGALETLANSIANYGLLHPIVCMDSRQRRRQGSPLRLIAGERRFKAITALHAAGRGFSHDGEIVPHDSIPYILVSNHNEVHGFELRLREVELEENIQREDLTWQERVDALNDLHQIRSIANSEQTLSDTAKEITSSDARGPSRSTVRKEIARAQIVAPYLKDPEVAKARSVSDAFSIVARKVEAEFVAELHRRGVGKNSIHTLVEGDLTILLPSFPTNTFTCTIADPPYGIDADNFGSAARESHLYADDPERAWAIAETVAREAYRVSRSEAHLYMFCDIEMFVPLRDALNARAEWKVWRTPLVWSKGNLGHAPSGISGLRRSYELILWAQKGSKAFGQLWNDVIEVATVRGKLHAAQKPVELYQTLLRRSCLPGDKVLDPCCGSGTIFPAANLTNVAATGIELDAAQVATARTRMEGKE